MRVLKLRPLFMIWSLLLIVTIGLLVSQRSQIIDNPTPTLSPTTTSPPTLRDLWNTRGGQNYEMVVEDAEMPAPPVVQVLTIQNGKVARTSILVCDRQSSEYHAGNCEAIRTYYSTLGIYTVEELFEIADFGLNRTREAMRKCSAAGGYMFRDFPNSDAMFAMAKTCEADRQSQDRVILTAVEYDPYYGYPSI